MIETVELTKRYGEFEALSSCSFSIAAGEVYGLLGPNGAGKSTLIRLLMGFLSPSNGQARIGGHDVTRERLATHRLVSYLPSSPKLFRTMSGKQVLRFFSSVRSDGDFDYAMQLADRLDLDLKRWVAFMSTGMRQKLAIACCFSIRAAVADFG
ncbi:MAG: ABC transporter ATP-binding protein [Pirellulaceae bacterium]